MFRTIQSIAVWALAVWGLSIHSITTADGGDKDLLLILDASGSMWGQIQGEAKIGIARRVVKDMVTGLPDDASVGLLAYGHRRKGDCDDIELVMPPGTIDKAGFVDTVEALNPKGKTPITRSVTQAFGVIKERARPGTIVLVTDGIESCGGDPCQTVRDAKSSGVEFILHVVGFDVQKENVAQLECAAQAGGGHYVTANNADELSAALDKTTEPLPDGRLSIKTLSNGELLDTGVRIFDAKTGDEVAFNRTYANAQTNPRVFLLADGVYDVQLQAVTLRGDIRREIKDIKIEGALVERTVDFTPGVIRVKVTRNGRLSDATVNAYVAGTRRNVSGGRTYQHAKSNPITLNLTPGAYDIEIGSVEMKGAGKQRITGIQVQGGDSLEHEVRFDSGTLRIGARRGGELVDAVVNVRRIDDNLEVARGRTYTSGNSNPKTMEIAPGVYRVTVKAVKLKDRPKKTMEVTITAGKVTEQMVEM